MDGFRLFILAMQLLSTTTMIVLAVPLCRRKVAPNAWYGFRVRRTLEDPAVWYDANAHAGRSFVGAGALIAGLSVALYFDRGLGGPTYAITCAAVTLLAVAAAVVRSVIYLRRSVETRERPS